ncbi:MAG: FecR domain-containing protein [Bacteroidales bacterium]|nr:FecR domain-containing protein [Candidatus Cryptobacteroides equifaecalis]
MTRKQEQLVEAFLSDQITDSQKAELISYLDTDDEFAASFKELAAACAAAYIPTFEKTREEDFRRIKSRIFSANRVGRVWKYLSIAACAATLLLLGSTIYFSRMSGEPSVAQNRYQAMTISATSGTGTEAVLPDGTKVRLNAESSLRLADDFGTGFRDVTLEGEGYFEVSHDAGRPFRVFAGETCVTVKGTTFNVRSYEDEPEITVSLLEGSVMLSTPSSEATLTPGFCAVVSCGCDDILVETADPSASAWTRGIFVFSDKSIPEILRSVERNYGVHFTYDDNLFGTERFTGNISYNLSIDEILAYVDVDRKYRWTRHDDTIVICKK